MVLAQRNAQCVVNYCLNKPKCILAVVQQLLEEGGKEGVPVVLARHVHGTQHIFMDVDRTCGQKHFPCQITRPRECLGVSACPAVGAAMSCCTPLTSTATTPDALLCDVSLLLVCATCASCRSTSQYVSTLEKTPKEAAAGSQRCPRISC